MRFRACCLGVFLLLACEAKVERVPVSQVLLRVDATRELRSLTKQLRIAIAVQQTTGARWVERRALSLPVESESFWPADIPIVPRDPAKLPALFEVVLEALDEHGSVLVQERALASFVKESVRVLELPLTGCAVKALYELCESDPKCHGDECRRCGAEECEPTRLKRTSSFDPDAPIEPLPEPPENDAGPDGAPSMPEAGSGGMQAAGTGGMPAAGTGGMPAAGTGGTPAAGTGGMPAAGTGGMPTNPLGTTSASQPMETWSDPARVDDAATDVFLPTSGSNSQGDLIAAWWQGSELLVRRFTGGRWDTPPVPLNGMPPASLADRDLVALGIDNTAVAQLLYTDGEPRTRWLRWNGETSLAESPEPSVLGDQTAAEEVARLTVTEAGLATAVWCGPALPGAGTRACYVNRLGPNGWASPQSLGMTGAALQSFGFGENGTGDFVALFRTRQGGASSDTLRSFIGRGTSVIEPQPFSLSEPVLSGRYTSTLDSAGNALALFFVGEPASPRVHWVRLAAGSNAWTAPAPISEQAVNSPQLVSPPNAKTAALWFEYSSLATQTGHLVVRRYEDSGWGEALKVSDEFVWKQGSAADIAGNSSGELVVAWNQDEPSKALRYARYSEATGWAKPQAIAPYLLEASIVSVNVDGDGRALVLWTETNSVAVHSLRWSRSTRQ